MFCLLCFDLHNVCISSFCTHVNPHHIVMYTAHYYLLLHSDSIQYYCRYYHMRRYCHCFILYAGIATCIGILLPHYIVCSIWYIIVCCVLSATDHLQALPLLYTYTVCLYFYFIPDSATTCIILLSLCYIVYCPMCGTLL